MLNVRKAIKSIHSRQTNGGSMMSRGEHRLYRSFNSIRKSHVIKIVHSTTTLMCYQLSFSHIFRLFVERFTFIITHVCFQLIDKRRSYRRAKHVCFISITVPVIGSIFKTLFQSSKHLESALSFITRLSDVAAYLICYTIFHRYLRAPTQSSFRVFIVR